MDARVGKIGRLSHSGLPQIVSSARAGLVVRMPGVGSAAERHLDGAICALLAIAILLPGVLIWLGLPSGIELLADLMAAGLFVWSVVLVLRSGRTVLVPYLLLGYAGILVVAALSADDLPRMIVSAKNFVLLAVLALALASLGTHERRNRLAVLTALALVVLQFSVMAVQAFTLADVDLVVGTFGDYSGPSTAFALEAGACLALGAYAATGQSRWLFLAVVLPLPSIWAVIRIVPIVFPIAGLATFVAALWASREPAERVRLPRRSAGVLLGVALGTLAVFGGYATFHSSELQVFTDSDARSRYLRDATTVAPEETSSARQENQVRGRGEETSSARQKNQVPGRGEQYRTAARLVSADPLTLIVGRGLGATTYAENLGVEKPKDSDLEAVGYSDFGTLLVETGWLGVAVVATCAVALGLAAILTSRRAPPGSWTRTLLVAYPGVLVAMAAGMFHGAPFRNIGSATLFWVLTGLALASALDWGIARRRPSAEPPGQAAGALERRDAAIQSMVRRSPSTKSTFGS